MSKPAKDEVRAEVDLLVDELRALCDGHGTYALFAALTEMYARVLSDSIRDDAEMERALAMFQRHARGWWIASQGGPFLAT